MAQQLSWSNLAAIFVVGNVVTMSGKVVAFYILVPISYLLIFSAGLVLPYRFFKYSYHLACLIFLLGVLVVDISGSSSYNLEFVAIGLLGVLVGFISIEKINRAVSHPYLLVASYACYTIAITLWNVPFPLLVAGAFLSIGAIYLAGLRGGDGSRARGCIVLLGRYSLFGYVAQIAILQFLSLGLRRLAQGYTLLGVSFVAAFALTIAAVEVLDRSRVKSAILDRAYKAVFA
jgi:hypothetical protein